MKGKAIENNIRLLDADALDETLLILFRYADERIVGQPAPRKCDYLAVKGHGKPLVFNFHYRSRSELPYVDLYRPCCPCLTTTDALQILGCIPRTESPARTIQDGEEAARKPVLATSDPDHTERERSQRAQEREKLQASHPGHSPGTPSLTYHRPSLQSSINSTERIVASNQNRPRKGICMRT